MEITAKRVEDIANMHRELIRVVEVTGPYKSSFGETMCEVYFHLNDLRFAEAGILDDIEKKLASEFNADVAWSNGHYNMLLVRVK